MSGFVDTPGEAKARRAMDAVHRLNARVNKLETLVLALLDAIELDDEVRRDLLRFSEVQAVSK